MSKVDLGVIDVKVKQRKGFEKSQLNDHASDAQKVINDILYKLENEKGQKKYKKAVKKWGDDLKYTRPPQPIQTKKYGGKISPRRANYS